MKCIGLEKVNAGKRLNNKSVNSAKEISFGSMQSAIIDTALNTAKDSAKEAFTKAEENVIFDAVIHKYLGKVGSFFNYLTRTAGEAQNLIVIGIGTAFVAPIFIAFNKLSKESQDNKYYSALRQPISAIIGTAIPLAVNIPIANWFSKAAALGKIKKFDMSAAPPEDYLKKRYNKIEKCLKSGNSLNNLAILKEKTPINKAILDAITEFSSDHQNFITNVPNYKEFVRLVHEQTLKVAAEKLLDDNNADGLKKKKLQQFLLDEFKIKGEKMISSSRDGGKTINPDYFKEFINNTNALTFLKKFGYTKLTEKELRTSLAKRFYNERFEQHLTKDMKEDPLAKEILNTLFDKIQDKFENKEKLAEELQKTLFNKNLNEDQRKLVGRLIELAIPEGILNEETISLRHLLKVLFEKEKVVKEQELTKLNGVKIDLHAEDLFNSEENLQKTMESFLNELEEKLAKDPVTPESLQKDLKEKAKNIAENMAKRAETCLKAYSKIQGIVLSLVVLPASCGILNWAYPRIMEKCFPKLSASKADSSKGGK